MTDYFELGRVERRNRIALLIRCIKAEAECHALREALIETRRERSWRITDAEKERLRTMRKNGLTCVQIAARTGWAKDTVSRVTRKTTQ